MMPRLVARDLANWATRVEQELEQRQTPGFAEQQAAVDWAESLQRQLASSGNDQPPGVRFKLDADEARSLLAALRAGQYCIETLVFGPKDDHLEPTT